MTETMREMTVADLQPILADHHRYWGERDMRAGHSFSLVREFGRTCFVLEADDGIRGYLIGWVSPDRVGYVHVIATRDDARGAGVGRRLHEEFAKVAAGQGAVRLKAITSTANTGSVAFHTGIGFQAEVVEDYAGPGLPFVVFTREL